MEKIVRRIGSFLQTTTNPSSLSIHLYNMKKFCKVLLLFIFSNYTVYVVSAQDTHKRNRYISEVRSLTYQSFELFIDGEEKDALKILRKAERITQTKIGLETPLFANICIMYATIYFEIGNGELTNRNLKKAMDICDTLSMEDENSAYIIGSLAGLCFQIDSLDLSEKYYLKIKSILPQNSNSYRELLYNLVSICYQKGRYSESESYLREYETLLKNKSGIRSEGYREKLKFLANSFKNLYLFDDAKRLYEEYISLLKKSGQNIQQDNIDVFINLAETNLNLGDYSISELQYMECKSICDNINLKNSVNYQKIISGLCWLYYKKGEFEKCLSLEETSEYHPNTFSSLDVYLFGIQYDVIAKSYRSLKNYKSSEFYFLKKIDMDEKFNQKKDISYIESKLELSTLYTMWGKHTKSEETLQDCSSFFENNYGNNGQLYFDYLNQCGITYAHLTQYSKSLQYFFKSKELLEKTSNDNDSRYIFIYRNIGNVYNSLGKFNEAEKYFLDCLDISQTLNQTDDIEYADLLYSMGLLYRNMGQLKRIESLFLESLNIHEKLGLGHTAKFAYSLNGLGLLYQDIGLFEKSETYLLASKEIFEENVEDTDADYIGILINLATLYSNTGMTEKAENQYRNAIKSLEKTPSGKSHINYLACLTNLAILKQESGDFVEAERLFKDCREIWRSVVGINHRGYLTSTDKLAHVYMLNGQHAEAETLIDTVVTLETNQLVSLSGFMSENDVSNYMVNVQSSSYFQIPSYIYSGYFSDRMKAVAYDNALFIKGFLQNIARRLNLLIPDNTETDSIFQQLKFYRYQLSKEYSKPLIEQKDVNFLEEISNKLESQLARQVSGYSEAVRQVKWQEVQSTLKADEAAIEFLRFQVLLPKASDSIMYAALVLRPGMNTPEYVPLFEEKDLKKVFYDSISGISVAYNSRGIVVGKAVNHVKLYPLLWKPLEQALNGVNSIYYTPAGDLHRINFDAIPFDQNKRLGDQYKLIRLTSTRSLVVPQHSGILKEETDEVVLYGGIQYELDTTDIKEFETLIHTSNDTISESMTDIQMRSHNDDGWEELKNTKQEAEIISQLLKSPKTRVKLFTQKDATEASFKQLGKQGNSPKVIHIATHGFFFPDPVDSASGSHDLMVAEKQPAFKISDNPMMRSGLILYGANYAWKNNRTYRPGLEDGILTAFEISQTNLSNTDLVVLSACETGLGDIQGNEGVYGLQRAFKIAGARYLIMSLWQVPDQETSDFMIQFYKNWLEQKMTIPDAFRLVQQDMRQRYPDNPVNWAGFVLIE
jgi:CHAT domain-containing protein